MLSRNYAHQVEARKPFKPSCYGVCIPIFRLQRQALSTERKVAIRDAGLFLSVTTIVTSRDRPMGGKMAEPGLNDRLRDFFSRNLRLSSPTGPTSGVDMAHRLSRHCPGRAAANIPADLCRQALHRPDGRRNSWGKPRYASRPLLRTKS